MSHKTFSSLIEANFNLGTVRNGWRNTKCAVCSDWKDRFGVNETAGTITFNCFNCGIHGGIFEGSAHISKKAKEVLIAFGITELEIDSILGSNFLKEEPININPSNKNEINLFTPEIELPPDSFQLGSTNNEKYQLAIIEYLIKRHIDPTKYNFFYSTNSSFKNRVIIPFYRNGKLIYWQARSINEDKIRWKNAAVKRNAVLFNYDKLWVNGNGWLPVCEGVFDALSCDGIALLGSSLSEAKKHLISKSRRKPLMVLHKDSNGKKLGYEAINLGWNITFAPGAAKDLNEAIASYGTIWTISEMCKNIPQTEKEAILLLKLNCK